MSTSSRIERMRQEKIAREVDACYRQRRRQLQDEVAARDERNKVPSEMIKGDDDEFSRWDEVEW